MEIQSKNEESPVRCPTCNHILKRSKATKEKMSRTHKINWKERFDKINKVDELSERLEKLMAEQQRVEELVQNTLEERKNAIQIKEDFETKDKKRIEEKYTFFV